VKNSDDIEAAISETAEREGKLDICIANAGGSAGPGFGLGVGIEDYPLETWQIGDRSEFDERVRHAPQFRENYEETEVGAE